MSAVKEQTCEIGIIAVFVIFTEISIFSNIRRYKLLHDIAFINTFVNVFFPLAVRLALNTGMDAV